MTLKLCLDPVGVAGVGGVFLSWKNGLSRMVGGGFRSGGFEATVPGGGRRRQAWADRVVGLSVGPGCKARSQGFGS